MRPVKLEFGHVELEVSYSQVGIWIKCIDLVGGVEEEEEREGSPFKIEMLGFCFFFFKMTYWVIKRESIELGKEFALEPQGL